MARMPGTDWIGPTPNRRIGGMSAYYGLVLHIQDGTEDGSEAWFKNPDSQASAHFLNPKAGDLRQLVDTDDRAWTEGAGNAYWISVENEGRGGDALTPSQIENCARLLAWIHQTYGAPLQLTDDPNGRGLGWHGMGGAAWGGHYDCPGKPVLAQRGQILARAQELTTPNTPEDDMPISPDDVRRFLDTPLGDQYAVTDQWGGRFVPTVADALNGGAYSTSKAEQALAAITASQAAITALATQLGQVHGVDTATVVAAVRDEIAKATVKVHVDVTGPTDSTTPKGA